MAPKRTKEESGARIGVGGKFEGEFKCVSGGKAEYLPKRLEVWKRLFDEQTKIGQARAAKESKTIDIILPDGKKIEGKSLVTTPLDVATGISKSLAKDVCVARVTYLDIVADADLKGDTMASSLSDDEEDDSPAAIEAEAVLWDLHRPLEGSCKIELFKFDHPKAAETYWHSSAHVLGGALEQLYGGYLCIGPPLEAGFYYDIFVGNRKISPDEFQEVEKKMAELAKQADTFERLVLTKEQALEVFQDNPFKVQLISSKIPDGAKTSAYRCGSLVDLCRGPHLPNTDRIKSAMVTKNSSAYWLGKAEYDSLQRVYGITFPNDKLMKDYKKMLEEAAENDHRNVGNKQELFFFHPSVSPGSCFWMKHGARLYNTLIEFIRREYQIRDFQEVITPNIYSEELFLQSGHAQNYKDCMYGFDVEGQEWFLKPMNCPGHCMVFDHRVRSYKELPLRMASFGVLHRNELSGTLSGLTRVRRFQQDDAHIFCRPEQIKAEVISALDFLYYVYGVFGFEFTIALSTRPKKAIGEKAVWDKAEAALKDALNESGREWSLNPGDGAFYGPKIDIKLTDALRRRHQCGTIQLDFQLPIRFGLQYRTEHAEEAAEGAKDAEKEEPKKEEAKEEEKGGKKEYVFKEKPIKCGFERPVIIHRAILGSVERMVAILTEHYGGKWPFWVSPRQVMVIPVSHKYDEYAEYVKEAFSNFGFFADVDVTGSTLNKKVRNAQIAQYNYMAVVGEKEEIGLSVCLRERSGKSDIGTFSLNEVMEMLKKDSEPCSRALNVFTDYKGRSPIAAIKAAVAQADAASSPSAPQRGSPKQMARKPVGLTVDDCVEEQLAQFPYVGGYTPSCKDADLYASLHSIPETPNMARWYDHMCSFTGAERAAWAAEKAAAPQQQKAAAAKAASPKQKPAAAASAKPSAAPAASSGANDDAIKKVGDAIRVLKEKLKGEGLSGGKINNHADVKKLVDELQALKSGAAPVAVAGGAAASASPKQAAKSPKQKPAAAPAAGGGGADIDSQITKVGDDIRALKEKLKGEGLSGKKVNDHAEIKELVAKLQELKALPKDAAPAAAPASPKAASPKQKASPKPEAKKKDKKGKAEEGPAKELTPEEQVAAREKLLKKVMKAGGKRGVEIEGAADMGGLGYFCTSIDEPDGDLEMCDAYMTAMNEKSDPTEEERKGGSGEIGKMIFSAGTAQLALVAYVPESKKKDLNATEWLKQVLALHQGEMCPGASGTYAKGFVKADHNVNKFPLKMKEPSITEAITFLKKKGLFPDKEDDSDDDYVFGDDDFPS